VNIITTKNFVAGIFEHWNDAQHYMTLKPSGFGGSTHTNTDLIYPFYLLELDYIRGAVSPLFVQPYFLPWTNRFMIFQTKDESLKHGSGTLYTIYEDYQPADPWTDCMGSLEHIHIDESP
jgi:hypothetical protein